MKRRPKINFYSLYIQYELIFVRHAFKFLYLLCSVSLLRKIHVTWQSLRPMHKNKYPRNVGLQKINSPEFDRYSHASAVLLFKITIIFFVSYWWTVFDDYQFLVSVLVTEHMRTSSTLITMILSTRS